MDPNAAPAEQAESPDPLLQALLARQMPPSPLSASYWAGGGAPQGAPPPGPTGPGGPPPTAAPLAAAPPAGLPGGMPPGPKHEAPAVQRFQNAQQMQRAYANHWSPNPVMLGVAGAQGKKAGA